MKKVIIYTDGACRGNPGKGGWGAVLLYNGNTKEISGGDANTTNNKMELTAAIEALKLLKEPCKVELYSDSKYLTDAINKEWVYSWKQKGWKKSDGKMALNIELWEELLILMEKHKVTYIWVKGHNGTPFNDRCDQLATAFADSL